MLKYPGPFPKKEWTKNEREQLASIEKSDLIRLLDRDPRWEQVSVKGARYVYRNPAIRQPYDYIVIHYHKHMVVGSQILFPMLDQICWTPEWLRKEKVLK